MATVRTARETIAWKLARLGVWISVMVLGTGCALFAPPSSTPFVAETPRPLPSATLQSPTPLASATAAAPATKSASPTDVPSASTPARRRIQFQPGATAATVQGTTATPGDDRFAIRALAGQTVSVSVASTQGPVILIIYGADGNVLMSDHAGSPTWRGTLPTTQDYYIDTRSVGSSVVPFTLQVTIPPK